MMVTNQVTFFFLYEAVQQQFLILKPPPPRNSAVAVCLTLTGKDWYIRVEEVGYSSEGEDRRM